jgi:hypothetical protein
MNSHKRFRLAIAIFSLLAMPMLDLYGQDMTLAKEGIGRLKGLPKSVQLVLAVIKGTNFGPFETSGSCGYDWQVYCFFSNCMNFNWQWTFPNYAWLKTDLESKYQRVSNQASQFDAAFSPVKTWLVVSLPEIGKQMEAAATRMESGDAANVKAAIVQLDTELNASAGRLESGYSSLTVFNRALNTVLEQASSRDAMEGVINRDQAALDQQVGTFPCGADDVRNKYNHIRDTVRGQFNQVADASQKFGVTSAQTDNDVSIVLGTLLATRGSVASVLKSLQNASVSPEGAIQQLRLRVVSGQWRDLSEYARQQLGN